jgi:hypothetical protein
MPISAYLSGAADAVLKSVSTLVPEKRRDKHGNLVTRHVKLPATLVGRTVVPAPTITRSVIAEGVIEGVMDTYASVIAGSDESYDETRVVENLKNLPDSTLNYISSVMNRNELHVLGIDCMVISMLGSEASAMEVDDAFFVFGNLEHRDRYDITMRTVEGDKGGLKVGGNLRGMMRGMETYSLDGFVYLPGEIPLRFQDEDTKRKVMALMEVSQVLGGDAIAGLFSADNQYTLRDKELAQLVVDYPDDTDMIIDLIGTRGSDDISVLRDVLSSASRSLSEGVL